MTCEHDWQVGTLFETWDFSECRRRKETTYYIYYACPKCNGVKREASSNYIPGPKSPPLMSTTSNILADWLRKVKASQSHEEVKD